MTSNYNDILNRYKKPSFNYDREKSREFADLKQLVDQYGLLNGGKPVEYNVLALFINDSGHFGENPNIIINDYIVNFPSHLTSQVKEMISDPELVEMVNNGKLGFTIYEYKNKFGKHYSINWVCL